MLPRHRAGICSGKRRGNRYIIEPPGHSAIAGHKPEAVEGKVIVGQHRVGLRQLCIFKLRIKVDLNTIRTVREIDPYKPQVCMTVRNDRLAGIGQWLDHDTVCQ